MSDKPAPDTPEAEPLIHAEPASPWELSIPAEEIPASDGFTIVGVGASAGGLEAFSELLAALPADTGMAFVVVQHLDPHHESILAELLANRTSMRVVQVIGPTPVEPNHVYVIPPNSTMVVSKRLLTLRPRSPSELHKPIDSFLISLARDRGANSIGVILSGTATDGTLGLTAIKAAGGITFCQDASAKFDSMPRSAVAAGAVDFVLPPARIAFELASLSKHPYYLRREEFARRQEGTSLQKILVLLRSRTSVDFTQYKQPTIQRRLMRRMALRNMDDPVQYLAIVERDTQELDALYDDLLINVTEFFRDARVFEALKRVAMPLLTNDLPDGGGIRVWVPGCSTGEELYSIAIIICEYLEENHLAQPIQLFGTDVSDRVIEKARSGFYHAGALAAVAPERLRRFFVRSNAGYQISRSIREMCIFSRHNVAKDPPLSRMNLISCRNLLIYLTPPLQKRVIGTFGYALQPAGCLVLGTSESLSALSDHFVAVDAENKIFCRKTAMPGSALDLPAIAITDEAYSRSRARERNQTKERARAATSDMQRFADRFIVSEYGPPGILTRGNLKVSEFRGDVTRFLSPNRFIDFSTASAAEIAAANLDLLAVAREEARAPLREAIEAATERQTSIRTQQIEIRYTDRSAFVRIVAVPIRAPENELHFLILFEESAEARSPGAPPREGDPADFEESGKLASLENELSATRQYLQAIIEELRSTNEEAQSSNEELQSTNEELQTAKEELQSTNEELNTVNAEMQSRNVELSQVNNDLLNLLSSMNMPIIMTGMDLRVRRFTPMAKTVLRLIPGDVGRSILDLQPRIRVPDLESILRGVLDTLAPHEEEVQDEAGGWHVLRVRPYRTADNRIDGIVLQLVDVGELKRVLDEVREARDYAQTIVDTVREPLLVLDQSLVVRNANRSFQAYFGTAAAELYDRNVTQIGNGLFNHPPFVERLGRLVQNGPAFEDVEIEQDVPQLGRRFLSITARRMDLGRDGNRILIAFVDVTERKLAAEARYRRLFESAHDGIMIVDAKNGEIADINPYLAELLGYARGELVGRRFWETEPFGALQPGEALLTRIGEQGVWRSPELTLAAKDQRAVEVEVIANIYSEASRRVIQFNLRDMTERRKFERELQHTAKLESLGLLAGGIAHDFNNLLTGILGNASLVYSEMPAGNRDRPFLREIIQAAERAAHLTHQMLAYSGHARVVVRRIDIEELITDILPLIRSSIPKTAETRLNFRAGRPAIDGDEGQIQQVLMNLVINAGEAIGEGNTGRIEISTALRELGEEDVAGPWLRDQLSAGRYVSIEVKDTGCGMDEDTQSRIFDPFFTTKFTGRGLGLAAVHGIIRGHRGAIRVYSQPGEGSTFQVLLPALPSVERSSRANGEPPGLQGSGTVLIVEDEISVMNVARNALERWGFRVLLAENGRVGVDLFRAAKDEIVLVLLDLTMPLMGGEEAFDRIREIREDAPIVVMTGFDQSEARRRFESRNLSGFLQKPFSVDQLRGVVAQAMKAA